MVAHCGHKGMDTINSVDDVAFKQYSFWYEEAVNDPPHTTASKPKLLQIRFQFSVVQFCELKLHFSHF